MYYSNVSHSIMCLYYLLHRIEQCERKSSELSSTYTFFTSTYTFFYFTVFRPKEPSIEDVIFKALKELSSAVENHSFQSMLFREPYY